MYQHLLLRDWAWQAGQTDESIYRTYRDENIIAINNVLSLIDDSVKNAEKVICLGSGAGRLSWDINCALKPTLFVAVDNNPWLSLVSHSIIKKKASIKLLEPRVSPQAQLSETHEWDLRCNNIDDERCEAWQSLCCDAWSLPFKKHSFDVLVTQWFLDINGRDAKDLIALAEQLLVPGGLWINYGPLLYPEDLPLSQQYTPEELRAFLRMSDFEIKSDAFFSGSYCHSPLSQKGRIEEVWGFVCQIPTERNGAGASSETFYKADPPAWYIMPHLPVLRFTQENLFPDALQNLADLFDGKNSINDVAKRVAANVPEGQSPVSFISNFIEQFVLK